MNTPYTLRTRVGFTVIDAHLLMSCARTTARNAHLPAPTNQDSALDLLITEDVTGDILETPRQYGLAVTATSTLVVREASEQSPHEWINEPFGTVAGTPIAWYEETLT